MLRYSVANRAANGIAGVLALACRLLVAAALGAQIAAYFYIALILANLLFIIPGSIFTSVLAEGSRWRPGLRGNALDGLFLSFAILLPCVAVAFVAGGWLLEAIKPSFAAGIPPPDVPAASPVFVAVKCPYAAVRGARA